MSDLQLDIINDLDIPPLSQSRLLNMISRKGFRLVDELVGECR